MAIEKQVIGTLSSGEEVIAYTLDNGTIKAVILNYGGIVAKLLVPDRTGQVVDVVLGYDNLEEWLNNDTYYGALIGRHANRIAKGQFELSGKNYQVGVNEGENSLHGGKIGFDRKLWNVTVADSAEPSIVLTLESPDGEEGFPGNLKVAVTYTVTSRNGLSIDYKAVCDQDTLVNLTNHSYFNLAGHSSGVVYDQILKINSDFFTPNFQNGMPTGQVWMVQGTPFDFTRPKKIGEDIHDEFTQIQMFGGFDHNYSIRGRGFREAVVAENPANGIRMTMMTNQPAMQLYTGNSIKGGRKGKDGAVYGQHHGFCLETQVFPNAMSFSHYPAPILKAGETYDHVTEYIFDLV